MAQSAFAVYVTKLAAVDKTISDLQQALDEMLSKDRVLETETFMYISAKTERGALVDPVPISAFYSICLEAPRRVDSGGTRKSKLRNRRNLRLLDRRKRSKLRHLRFALAVETITRDYRFIAVANKLISLLSHPYPTDL